jgi:hypothetical protein
MTPDRVGPDRVSPENGAGPEPKAVPDVLHVEAVGRVDA